MGSLGKKDYTASNNTKRLVVLPVRVRVSIEIYFGLGDEKGQRCSGVTDLLLTHTSPNLTNIEIHEEEDAHAQNYGLLHMSPQMKWIMEHRFSTQEPSTKTTTVPYCTVLELSLRSSS
jgi:hypothetical protein